MSLSSLAHRSLGRAGAAVAAAALLVVALTAGPVVAQDDVAPSAPSKLTATVVSSTTVTLSWNDPDDSSITGYMILRRDTKNQATGTFTTLQSKTGNAATTSYTDSAAEPGTKYAYRIKALNDNGTSEQSDYVNVTTPAVPYAPGNLTATAKSSTTVTLSWNDPQDSSITGYMILRRDTKNQAAGTFTTLQSKTGNAATTSYTDSAAESGTKYAYRIKAHNDNGASEQSNYVNVTTPAQTDNKGDDNGNEPRASVPAAPGGLNATPGDEQVTLSWDDPGDDTITKYQYRYGEFDGGSLILDWTDISGSGADTTTYTVTGLTNDTVYFLDVRAVNSAGNGALSHDTATPQPSAPAAPGGLNATAGDEQVTLTWDDPNDSTITKYQVRYRSSLTMSWGEWADISGSGATTTMHTVTGLLNGDLYTFEVRAVNAGGNGSSAQTSATPRIAAPVNLRATPGDGRVILNWDNPVDDTITGYRYRVSDDDGNTWSPSAAIPGSGATTTTHTVTDLDNGTEYTFEVVARETLSIGISARVKATPTPDTTAPQFGSAAVSGTSLRLVYDEPLDTNSVPAPGAYTVRAGGSTVSVSTVGISGNVVTLTLATAVLYDQSVRVSYSKPTTNPLQDIAGNDAAGLSNQTVTNNTPPPLPAAPANFEASPGDTRVSLSWDNPSNSTITKYQYRYKVTSSSSWSPNWTDIPGSGSATTAFAESSLTNDTDYTSEVRAVNSAGNGAASSNTATPVRTPDTTAPLLSSAAVNGTSLQLAYDEPLDTNSVPVPSAYTVRVGSSNVSVSTVEISGSVVTLTLATTAEDTDSVRVTYSVPTSNPVQDQSGNKAARLSNRSVTNNTPAPNAPGAPTGLTATAQGQNRIDLSWTAPASTGGSAITGYRIEVSEDGGSAWKDLVANTRNTVRTYAHTGLELGSTRHYRVSAINRGGTSAPSDTASATTDSRPFATLSARRTGYDSVPTQVGTQRIPRYEITIVFSQPVESVADKFLQDKVRSYLMNATMMSWGAVPDRERPVSGGPWLTTWRMEVIPHQPRNGGTTIITFRIPEGVVKDAAERLNRAATPFRIEVNNLPPADTNKPRVLIRSKNGTYILKTSPFTIEAVFNEGVTGFEQNDFRVSGGSVTSFKGVSGGTTYEAKITPSDTSRKQTIQISIPAGAAQDAAGNSSWEAGEIGFQYNPFPDEPDEPDE